MNVVRTLGTQLQPRDYQVGKEVVYELFGDIAVIEIQTIFSSATSILLLIGSFRSL